jgi:hypothetical protein
MEYYSTVNYSEFSSKVGNKGISKENTEFLNSVIIGQWSVNPNTGFIDVEGDVRMESLNLTKIPVKFGKVSGDFNCSFNLLTNLEGAPESVGGSFNCKNNKLYNLSGAPKSVGDTFICYHNKLTSLKFVPHYIGNYFGIYLGDIDEKYHSVIITELEMMIEKGIKLYKPEEYYYPYK